MSPSTKRKLNAAAWFGAAAISGGGCDLQTKSWAEAALQDLPTRSIHIIDPWVEASLRYNRGTAFSVIPDLGDARIFFGVLSLIVVAVLMFAATRPARGRFEIITLGAIAGGALGNGVDRLLRGGVVDFIKVNYPWGGSWPAFNIADALLVVGVAALLIVQSRREEQVAEADTGSG